MVSSLFYPHCNIRKTMPMSCLGRDRDSNKQNIPIIKVNGHHSTMSKKLEVATQQIEPVPAAAAEAAVHGYFSEEQIRQNIPKKKQSVDPYRQGLITEGGVGYRQTVVIRSYEVGPDKTATIESILNLLQETALNHVWMSGLLGDGFGATHGMMRNNLIWVVSRMQLEVDHYPIWGEVMEIDTWVGASGKNGMRRDWLLKSHTSGLVFARATSTWVMMNQKTRRLSKMPDEVRSEISPWFVEKQAIEDDANEKIYKLDEKAKYINSDLKTKRSDLDMNHHVNNVKYLRWMLETLPDEFMEDNQLSSIVLEYRRECGSSDVVQSLCQPEEEEMHHNINGIQKNGFSVGSPAAGITTDGILPISLYMEEKKPLKYTHLLQVEGATKNEEILRGRTSWRRKSSPIPF
ncbi:palmitoyl-acyl carrier protein thioesterase, chloroplastic-like [Impatiens glandulifera]|uniref:palmitoyl-acyl carrier protein thioesterase, chloroplastic-like n=1 Tax=Impatiens glandulifera TaxID=253017 RepID=UPI001FB0CBCF|nr:palmitoyl-acyl carrier protein thioesterase, chloroplastic-like [Impatiens glandulifera]